MSVVVLGMHRSGTSATTRLVNLLGVPMCPPDDLVAGHEGNERGHWESGALVRVDEDLLARLGARWWCPPAERAGVEALAGESALVTRARDVFRAQHPGDTWVWKDPRTCLLLPFWSVALETKPVVLFVVRDPLECATSLSRRDGISVPYALALWERYCSWAWQASVHLPMIVARYEDVVADPDRWCRETARTLSDLGVPASAPADMSGVRAFVAPGMRHQPPAGLADALSDEQRHLWSLLQGLPARPDTATVELPDETPTVRGMFEDMRREFDLAAPSTAAPRGRRRAPVSAATGVRLLDRTPTPGRPRTTRPRVSVVALGGRADVRDLVMGLRGFLPGDAELVIVSGANHGTGEHGAQTEGSGPDVVVVDRVDARGAAQRLNAGAEVARGDVFVFLGRGPVTPHRGWLPLLQTELRPADVGAVGPGLLAEGQQDPVTGLTIADDVFSTAWLRATGPEAMPVPALSSHVLVTRRAVFDQLAGFDPGLDGSGGEDLDFCLRLWRSGFRCLGVPAAQVVVGTGPGPGGDDAPARLRTALRLGLVHLRDDALQRFLRALAGVAGFGEALAAVSGGDVGRRRVVVDALSWYALDGVPARTGVTLTPRRVESGPATASRSGQGGNRAG